MFLISQMIQTGLPPISGVREMPIEFRDRITGPGTYAVRIAGTAAYQDELRILCREKQPSGKQMACVAQLVSEPENVYDSNAIRVEIGGNRVGYLPRELARDLCDWLRLHQYSGISATCDAIIVGGWESFLMAGYSEGSCGLRIDSYQPGTPLPSLVENQSEFVFVPKLQAKIEGNYLIHAEEEVELRQGDPVNFGSGDDRPSEVRIYARGTTAGFEVAHFAICPVRDIRE